MAGRHARALFEAANYTVVREPAELSAALLDRVRSVILAVA